MFGCTHEWEKDTEITMKSKLEILNELELTSSRVSGYMVSRKYVVIYICKKCGKIKKFVEEN